MRSIFHYRQNFLKIRKKKFRELYKKFGFRKGYTYIPRVKEIIKVMQVTEKIKAQVGYFRIKEIEVIKPEFYVDTMKLADSQSEISKKEDKDCVVRAFMAALDIPYDKAHAWVKKELGRKDRKGTYTYAYAKNIIGKTKNSYKISFIGAHPSCNMQYSVGSNKVLVNRQYKKQTGYTLKSFMENNPVGRFVLIVQDHAVAVVNGVLYGNTNENQHGLYRSVWYGFECK